MTAKLILYCDKSDVSMKVREYEGTKVRRYESTKVRRYEGTSHPLCIHVIINQLRITIREVNCDLDMVHNTDLY